MAKRRCNRKETVSDARMDQILAAQERIRKHNAAGGFAILVDGRRYTVQCASRPTGAERARIEQQIRKECAPAPKSQQMSTQSTSSTETEPPARPTDLLQQVAAHPAARRSDRITAVSTAAINDGYRSCSGISVQHTTDAAPP